MRPSMKLFSSFALLTSCALLAGCKGKGSAPVTANGPVNVTADGDGFKPSSVKFVKGSQATLIFTRTTDETCATEVVFPALDLKKDLPKGQPVTIALPSDKEQTLTFQCGMGMYKSSVVIAAN